MNHYQEAERLLAEAQELFSGPRVGVVRNLATMAQAHATLALVKATRQATNDAQADLWDEGWQAHLLASTPGDLSPEERLIRAIFETGDNPYRIGEGMPNADG